MSRKEILENLASVALAALIVAAFARWILPELLKLLGLVILFGIL